MEKEDQWPHSTRTEKGSMNAELGCSVKGLTLESSPLQNSHVWFCRFDHILCVLIRQEFQSMLGASQASMDGTIKTGKVLMDKSPQDDSIMIEGKIADLKARWDAICALSVERLVIMIFIKLYFCTIKLHLLHYKQRAISYTYRLNVIFVYLATV